MIDLENMTDVEKLEFFAHSLAVLGKKMGYNKITDKSKWREPIVAGKLGHVAFEKISAGKNSDKYGADAIDEKTGKMAEYKSMAIEDKQLNNLLQRVKNKKGGRFAPLTVVGVYNGAYTHEAIDAYEKHDHYFSVFYDEKCLLIIKPKHDILIGQLREEVDRRIAANKGGTTNLNTVRINLGDVNKYDITWRDEEWFKQNG